MITISDDIKRYIPQRAPFVMIDQLLYADEKVSRSQFHIGDGHLFVNNGVFTEAGIVENMAQTAAAGTGYKTLQEGKPAPVGFIGSLKNLNILAMPKAGDDIVTEVSFVMQVMNVHIVQGRVFHRDKEIANCELKIFLQES